MSNSFLKKIDYDKLQYNKKVTYSIFRGFILKKQFKCRYKDVTTIFTYTKDVKYCNKNNKVKIIRLSQADFTQFLIKLYGNFIETFCKNTRKNSITVKKFNFKKFKIICISLTVILLSSFALLPVLFFCVLNIMLLYHIICVIIKSIFLIYTAIKRDDFEDFDKYRQIRNKKKLPKYTILVPMFKENQSTVRQSINAINEIEYPKDLLDVKLVLEEDDLITREVIDKMQLPDWIIPVFVPYFEPRTKPKACNVASLFATGEYLVIFDAEDIPDKFQLLKAVYEFNKDKDLQILQGCLRFYNHRKNLLTQCFNIEYSVWFKNILRMLSFFNITIPLGGTSNHIRFSCLEKCGFWDGYNVTEDLELSIIANEKNIKIGHLDSDTKEWCVLNVGSFIKQRTRWLKGYLLTYLTHFNSFLRTKNIKKMFFFHLVVGFSGLSFLLFPFNIFYLLKFNNDFLLYLWFCCNVVYYFSYIFLYFSLLRNIDILLTKKMVISFIIYPVYFILHILSAWKAFFEIFYKPFYWAKTKHNV